MNDQVNTPKVSAEHDSENNTTAFSEDINFEDAPPSFSTDRKPASKEDWAKFRDEVKNRSRLEDIIQPPNGWDKRKADDWYCSSPLRPGQDSTPSFHIDITQQVWKDFGLDGKGGDVFTYLERLWSCSFIDALKRRAAELNIPLPKSTPLTDQEKAEINERELVETILTKAAEHYHKALPSEMRLYLNNHYGFTDTTINKLKIGFDDGSLYENLKTEGYSDFDMALTGLFGNAEKDRTRFIRRITFPYWRANKVVYFAARQTRHTPPFIKNGKDITPKYLKLKVGPTGDEVSCVSKTITNDHFWGEDCGERVLDLLLIPEGMPDAISAYQAGYNVISPITVTFRDGDHDKLLRLCKRAKLVILVPDQESNGSGMKGAFKTCLFLCKHGVDARILILPHEQQKAEAKARVEQLQNTNASEAEIKNAAEWKVDLNEWMRGRTQEDLQALINATVGHIQSMIRELPADLDPDEYESRLRPILNLVAVKPETTQDKFIDLIKSRIGGTKKALLVMLNEEITNGPPKATEQAEQSYGGFLLTDLGNAERLHEWRGKIIRYVPEWKCFLVFTGKQWKLDRGSHLVRRLAEKMVKAELDAASKIEDPEIREVVIGHWTRCQGRKSLDNMVDLLKDQPRVCIEAKSLDNQPYLVSFQNGTLDLEKRELRAHDPKDLLTQTLEHNYNPEAKCPLYLSYLKAAQPDPEVREWLHRRDGSFLAADPSDQLFVVHYGSGGTGKGTRYRVLKHVLGDYVVKAPRSVFESHRYRPHPADLMTLRGRRLAYGSEISPYLDVDQINELTGEEDFQARGMGENFTEVRPTYKLEVMTNKNPIIKEDPDNGIWRRLRIVPWRVKFVEGDNRDNKLFDKLKIEAEGVLAWLVQGCYKWMDHGLTQPKAIMLATEQFAAEQDNIAPFIEEVCDCSDPDALVLADELFKARQAWNTSRNERPNESQKSFGEALKAHGISHGTPDPKTRRTRWKGIKLRAGIVTFNLAMEGHGWCATWLEDEAEVIDWLESIREPEQPHLRLLEAV